MKPFALLLNASMEPIHIVSARRAFTLLLSGKAEPVEEGERPTILHSSSGSFLVPAVLRLVQYVRIPYRATVPLNKRAVLERDGYVCQFTHCDRIAKTMDHVIPRSRKGKHIWENVVAACQECNSTKDNKLLSEIGWKLKAQPYVPKGWVLMRLRYTSHPEWQPYLGMATA